MRILIIEDDPPLQRSLIALLRDENYAVDSASDGKDGLFKAKEHEYDAIVLDVLLPQMNGLLVLRHLRQTRRTPVLILTALDAIHDRVKGLDGGADDYLPKPFANEELLARLRALVRRSAGQTQSIISVRQLLLDTASRRVRLADQEVYLTAREYSLLEYLVLHRGEFVTRTKLYEHLFDENDATMSNILDVHVSNLRKKLGADLIKTRRGYGYCIE